MPDPPFPTRPGSPLAAVFGTPSGPAVPMPWSLGVLGDLLWTRLPETRPPLADLMVWHIESAVNANRELIPVLAGEMVPDALWLPVLRPTLDRFPADRERLAEQLSVVFEAYQAEGPDQDGIRYALHTSLFEHLMEPGYREIVAEVHPRLSALVARVLSS
jgi:hypothetical protein